MIDYEALVLEIHDQVWNPAGDPAVLVQRGPADVPAASRVVPVASEVAAPA